MDQFNDAYEKLIAKLGGWIDQIVLAFPNLVLAALVMVFAIFAARYVNKYANKAINRMTQNTTVSSVLSSVITAVFVLLMLFLILSILGLDKALTSLLAGAGVIGLAVGLALQDPLINLFSGVVMSVRKLYSLGDLVETNGFTGRIFNISLRETHIKTLDGDMVVIPNKEVVQNPLKNYSESGERRVVIDCGVSYGDDLEKVREIAKASVKDNIDYDDSRDIDFLYKEFGDSSINFMLRFWLKNPSQSDYLMAKSNAIIALKKAFDKNDIAIPFPIRTLDFGVKGGRNVEEAIPFVDMMNNSSEEEQEDQDKDKNKEKQNGTSKDVTT